MCLAAIYVVAVRATMAAIRAVIVLPMMVTVVVSLVAVAVARNEASCCSCHVGVRPLLSWRRCMVWRQMGIGREGHCVQLPTFHQVPLLEGISLPGEAAVDSLVSKPRPQ